jgi:hypothetical protein
MACLSVGVALPLGVVDIIGVVHYVKWNIGRRQGCFRLCDFEDGGEALHKDKVPVYVHELISVKEP